MPDEAGNYRLRARASTIRTVPDIGRKRKPAAVGDVQPLPVIPVYRVHSRKSEIDAILSEHAQGVFMRASQLVDEVMTDDRIAGVVETRIGALMSAELEIAPAHDRRKDRKLADLVGGTDDSKGQGLWQTMVPPAALFDLLKWGLMLGVGVAQIVWPLIDGQIVPQLVPWHPQYLRWDWESRRYLLQTVSSKPIYLPDPYEQPYGDGNWFVWAPRGHQLGWLNGMVRSLAQAYIGRQWNFRDWSRYNEKHGMGWVKASVPAWAKEEDKDSFFGSLSNANNEAAVMCPQSGNKDQAGFDIAIVEPTSRSWEAFKEYKAALDVDIAVRVLGQNLTTEISGDTGSRAASQTHDLVRLDKAIEDAQIGPALRCHLLGWWAQYNYGDRELAPLVKYHVEPAADAVKIATGLKTLGEGVGALKTAEPRVDTIAILEAEGVPIMDEQDMQDQQPPDGPNPGDIESVDPQPSEQDMADIKAQIAAEEGASVEGLTAVIVPAGEKPSDGDEELPLLDGDWTKGKPPKR